MIESVKSRSALCLPTEAREDAQKIGFEIFRICLKLLGTKDTVYLTSRENEKYSPIEIWSKKVAGENEILKDDKALDLVLQIDNKEGRGYLNDKIINYIFRDILYETGTIAEQSIAFNPNRTVEEKEIGKDELEDLLKKIKESDQYKSVFVKETKEKNQ